MTTIWMTKYGLSDGILRFEGEIGPSGMANGPGAYSWYLHKGDYALSEAEALAQVEQMRQRRLKSLERQMEKLRTLKNRIRDLEDET